MLPSVLLAGLLAAFVLFLRGDARRVPGARRLPRFALIAAKAAVLFGLTSLAALVVAGELEALSRFPDALLPARTVAVALLGDALPLRRIAQAMAMGILAGGVVAALVERRGRRFALGDYEAVLPRRPRELLWGAALSVNAGVSEELFFRLVVPLLAAQASGSAVAGCALGAVLFALAHRYQGWTGVAATLLTGVLLALVYLVTASLLAAIAVHVVIDLNALVLRPVLSGRVRWGSE